MDTEKEKEKRKDINKNIIKRFKAGDPLQGNSDVTWFPPRPIIAKDEKHIKELYGENIKIVGLVDISDIPDVPKLTCIQNNQMEGGNNGQREDQREGKGNGDKEK